MITLSGVTKTYNPGKPNAFTALESIDLSLDGNRITVIKGPSGSGKSTLLSIIGAMARPTAGRVFFGDREITSLPERFLAELRRRQFGFIFQGNRLMQGMTVLENVMAPAYPTGAHFRSIKKRAHDLLDHLGIGAKAELRVELLSGGEQQRCAIARALINNPSFLIADEPTAHLDTDLANDFLSIAADLAEGGKTILIASHDPLISDWQKVERIISLRDGRIVTQENGS